MPRYEVIIIDDEQMSDFDTVATYIIEARTARSAIKTVKDKLSFTAEEIE